MLGGSCVCVNVPVLMSFTCTCYDLVFDGTITMQTMMMIMVLMMMTIPLLLLIMATIMMIMRMLMTVSNKTDSVGNILNGC